MSPSNLEVLIHYHCTASQHLRYEAPAIIEATKKFLRDDIIKVDYGNESGYSTTEKGRAWLSMILKTPYPTQCWVDDNGNRIKL